MGVRLNQNSLEGARSFPRGSTEIDLDGSLEDGHALAAGALWEYRSLSSRMDLPGMADPEETTSVSSAR